MYSFILGRWHLHHFERWRVRVAVRDADHQPAAVGHPRHARVLREARRKERTGECLIGTRFREPIYILLGDVSLFWVFSQLGTKLRD